MNDKVNVEVVADKGGEFNLIKLVINGKVDRYFKGKKFDKSRLASHDLEPAYPDALWHAIERIASLEAQRDELLDLAKRFRSLDSLLGRKLREDLYSAITKIEADL